MAAGGGGGDDDDGAGTPPRSLSAAGPPGRGNGWSAESALVDQMELPKGVVVDHGLRPPPRREEVGAVGELELLGHECRESLVGVSQMEEAELNSGQLC